MKQRVVATDYLQAFRCTGSACADTCCHGWNVNVDKRTFVKYKKLKDAQWKRTLTRHIRRNKYETSFSAYATIAMGEGGYCPFLNEDRLCSIHLSLGPNYLSSTCASYPRLLNKVYDTYESSGALSCPEIARLALLNPQGLSFATFRMEIPDNPLLDKLLEEEGFRDTFSAIRSCIIRLLQERSLSLDSRLLALGLFIRDLEQAARAVEDDELEAMLRGWQARLAEKRWPEELASFPIDPKRQFQLLSGIVAQYVADTRISSARYLQCYQDFRAGTEGSAERYQAAYERYFVPFQREHAYMLENYLVHSVFAQLFPFSMPGETLFAEYLVLILRYALMRMHLIGMAAAHQGMTPDLALILMQSFSRTYEHDVAFYSKTLRLLRDGQFDSLACMSVLIRNEHVRA
ncbi:hypothetical protein G3578_20010 [Brevibacillus sp. SYP-B805]|uniref:flagellin lysine-N-methylase n=1 Tax=Brevibacillus sp. SYP-B805 TaxID=1578199 RepID=UPI0013ED4BB2|nr:flagellin lysine-N-methylase [Brevibacillus sp. SYP-B805]NGQ97427.1 hypothetical protein [Brevibacillus sp. SYP-B805]